MECGREGSSNCPFVPAFCLVTATAASEVILLVQMYVDMRANEEVM